ncbi:MAG: hypothetical protein ACLTVB_08810 [Sutterella sp.]|jgi:hypothetical protein
MNQPPGENEPPVEQVPESYDFDYGAIITEAKDSLNWREMVDGAKLEGPLKNLAYHAQVLSLGKTQAVLRVSVAAFATEANREYLERQFTKYLGHQFFVRFEVGELTDKTVGEEVSEERIKAQQDRIKRFKTDPLVHRFMTELGAVLEESTVKEQH